MLSEMQSSLPNIITLSNNLLDICYDVFEILVISSTRVRTSTPNLRTSASGRHIHFYDTEGIHSALRMPPQKFFLK